MVDRTRAFVQHLFLPKSLASRRVSPRISNLAMRLHQVQCFCRKPEVFRRIRCSSAPFLSRWLERAGVYSCRLAGNWWQRAGPLLLHCKLPVSSYSQVGFCGREKDCSGALLCTLQHFDMFFRQEEERQPNHCRRQNSRVVGLAGWLAGLAITVNIVL